MVLSMFNFPNKGKKALTNEEFRKQTILTITVIVIAFVLILILLIALPKKSDESVSTSSSISTHEDEPEEMKSEDLSDESKAFTLMESKSPTKQGRSIMTGTDENGEVIWDKEKELAEQYCTAETATGEISQVGNPIYQVPTEFIFGDIGESTEESGIVKVQLFGYTPMLAESPSQFMYPRKERNGKKIYLFDSKEEEIQFQTEWKKGMDIIEGRAAGNYGDIIVNGRYLTAYSFREIDGEIYVPLASIGQVVDPIGFHVDAADRMVTFTTSTATGEEIIRVPYTTTSVGSNANHQTFEASVSEDNSVVETFRAGDTTLCYVPVSELSRYTGWKIYTNGDVVSIVTDELNVSNLTAIRPVEVNDYETEDTIGRYTDPDEVILPTDYPVEE